MQPRGLVLLVLCFSSVSAQALTSTTTILVLPLQTATISTLPPAQPTSSDANPCQFADRNELLDRVINDWQGYNVSLLVQTALMCVSLFLVTAILMYLE